MNGQIPFSAVVYMYVLYIITCIHVLCVQNDKGGVSVKGLTGRQVHSEEEALNLLFEVSSHTTVVPRLSTTVVSRLSTTGARTIHHCGAWTIHHCSV